jgi:two-component system chemotaxis response regulator CheB
MTQALVIGGSAGSFKIVSDLLKTLSGPAPFPIFLCLHRLKQVRTGIAEILGEKAPVKIIEPTDKTKIEKGIVYLAPANYHMFIEDNQYISLTIDPPVNHSRPSIDICFGSAAEAFGKDVTGILLSGANRDGTSGMIALKKHNSYCIIQDPDDCEISTMTKSALQHIGPDKILTAKQIIDFIYYLSQKV